VLIPGALAVGASGSTAIGAATACLGIAAAFTGAGWYLSRTGFDRLFRELPF